MSPNLGGLIQSGLDAGIEKRQEYRPEQLQLSRRDERKVWNNRG